ncbi:unnamed protein product [Microthlaspi erraticum]|uniref:F-box domain-containing protein n=1 Tax=Microthlaspi erraticum TaxID=1685480 RepID=A0A6D2K8J0_9BRAS|nr:unnamed protein product [Microthlaspi erraticum]
MKERVEVNRKIKKKRREGRRKSTTFVPPDIISEILSKLPLKSLMRFRCVSKLWSSITTDPYFLKSLQTTRPSRLLVVGFRKRDGFFVLSFPQQNLQKPNEPSQPINSYRMTHANPGCPFTIATGSVQGLMICFLEPTKPIVWNPSINKLLPLSKPGDTWKGVRVFLGYDPIEGKHKVVCMPKLTCVQALDECKVLTLGSGSAQEPWRKIETIRNHFPLTAESSCHSHPRCINGVVYYHAKLGPHQRVIMSFDVRSEKFHAINLPLPKWTWRLTLSYHGKFACTGYNIQGNKIIMFVLKDAMKHEWSRHLFSSLPEHWRNLNRSDVLMGDTDDDDGGELIFVRAKSLEFIYIHPKRKTLRSVNYRGVLDDFRQRNGLEDTPLAALAALDEFQLFPNHIETLSSL